MNKAGGGPRLTPSPAFHRNHQGTSKDSKALLGRGPQSPFSRHACLHCPLASSHPSKAKPDRGPSLASGRPPPELFSHTRGEPPRCHSHSSAYNMGVPGPWLTRPQCPLCAQSRQIWGLLRPVLRDGKTTGSPGLDRQSRALWHLTPGCCLQGSRPVPWAGPADCSEPFPRSQPAQPPHIAVSRLGLCCVPQGADLLGDRARARPLDSSGRLLSDSRGGVRSPL